jgi:hypothetical protein
MSRRRNTTARMFSDNRQGGAKRPSQGRPSTPEPGSECADGPDPAQADEPLVESLRRQLADEAWLRESSETRMATVVRRYLRLTIALAGINALVAGTTVFTLWSRSGSGSDAASMANLPAAQPKLSYPTPPPAPVASPTPSPAPVAPAPPAETVSPLPSPKPAASAPTPRPRRSVAKTQVAHRPVEDLKTVALDSVVERW